MFSDGEIARLAREATAIDCVAASGGVVVMRPLTIHASSKAAGNEPRRILHVEYAAAVNMAAGIELAVA